MSIENLNEYDAVSKLMQMWAASKVTRRVYPCTVISARYDGTYEGGQWLAFHCYPDQIPPGATDSDVECAY